MDRIYQWVWDRHGPRYSWVAWLLGTAVGIPAYGLWAFLIVAVERSSAYIETTAITLASVMVLSYLIILPGRGWSRLIEQWAAGREVSSVEALGATYAWVRGSVGRAMIAMHAGAAQFQHTGTHLFIRREVEFLFRVIAEILPCDITTLQTIRADDFAGSCMLNDQVVADIVILVRVVACGIRRRQSFVHGQPDAAHEKR